MKTLEQNNLENIYQDNSKPQKNNIECPKCKSELYDTNPNITLTSNPPKKEIHCDNCDYKGYRNC